MLNKQFERAAMIAGRCDEMKSVAEHATLELGPALNSDVHLTLSYTEAEEKQQVLTTWVNILLEKIHKPVNL